MSANFTPGELTGPQARALNELARITEQFSRLTVAPPLSLTRPAGIPAIRLDDNVASPAFVGAQVYTTGSTTIPSGTATEIAFDGRTFDTSSFWSSGASTKLTVPETGYYQIGCTIAWPSATFDAQTQIWANGQPIATDDRKLVTLSTFTVVTLSTMTHQAVSDYFSVAAYQLTGVNQSVGGIFASLFWAYKVG